MLYILSDTAESQMFDMWNCCNWMWQVRRTIYRYFGAAVPAIQYAFPDTRTIWLPVVLLSVLVHSILVSLQVRFQSLVNDFGHGDNRFFLLSSSDELKSDREPVEQFGIV